MTPWFPVRISNWQKQLLWAIPIIITWFFFWYGSWQMCLHSFIWLRLGMGLVLFIIPGACIYGLLVDRSNITLSHITFGFVISHLLFAIFGTLGRFTHISFETIKFTIAIAGLILILLYFLPMILNGNKVGIKTNELLPVSVLIMVSVAACLIVIQRVLTDDDLTYLAYVTNWQNAIHLGFNDIIFGEPGLVHPRFWLMSAPFAQALLADLSKVPGILIISGYYEPFLVIISVLCWYELARTLEFSPRAASASSILQLAFLLLLSEYLHPGAPFFNQLSADKATAAFILAPVFFQSLIRLLKHSTKSNFVLFFLAGLSLTFMHPVVLAYSVFIGGILVLFNLKGGHLIQKVLPLAILFAILTPQIALRFANTQTQEAIPYSAKGVFNQRGIETLIKRWGNTEFYGFNPSVLDMTIPYEKNLPIPEPITKRGWLILPILSAVFALKRVRNNIAAQFILACFLLCLLAGIPFTGWIIGYFLSAWMLERALWLFPFGLSTVFTISIIWDNIKARLPAKTSAIINNSNSSNSLLISIAVVVLGLFLLFMRENSAPNLDKFAAKSQRYQDIAMAGQALDNKISDQAHVMGSQNFNDLIPGISWKSKLVTFRLSDPSNMYYFTPVEIDERIMDTGMIFSKSTSAEDKLSLLRKYNVRFLLLQRDDIRLFNDLIANHPNEIKATDIGGVIIIEIE